MGLIIFWGTRDPTVVQRKARVFWAEFEVPAAAGAVYNRTASDTGQTHSDTLARTAAKFRTPTADTGQTHSDSIARLSVFLRAPTADTGQAHSDSIAIT